MAVTQKQREASERATTAAGERIGSLQADTVIQWSSAGMQIGNIGDGRSLDENIQAIKSAEAHLTTVRRQLQQMRKLVRTYAHRVERQQNGVFLP